MAGLILRYKVANRQVSRRAIIGLQLFRSYDQFLVTSFGRGVRGVGVLLFPPVIVLVLVGLA